MREEDIVSMMEQIEAYIDGQLTLKEIHELWEKFLVHPDWMDYLEIMVQLRYLIRSRLF